MRYLPVHTVLALCVGLLLPLWAASLARAQHTLPPSFNQANKPLTEAVAGHEATFSCHWAYPNPTVNHAGGGCSFKQKGQRAKRLEGEHVAPARPLRPSFHVGREGHPEGIDHPG
jgi:hypothetical protein